MMKSDWILMLQDYHLWFEVLQSILLGIFIANTLFYKRKYENILKISKELVDLQLKNIQKPDDFIKFQLKK